MAQEGAPTKNIETKRRGMSDERMGSFVRMMVLVWSGGLLTMYYLGGLGRLDTTFIGGLLTQTLAGFGVVFTNKKKEETPTELSNQPTRKSPPIK